MNICVFGASSAALAQKYYDDARHLGALMAQGGHTLVFGGGAKGVMGAVSEGAALAGGQVTGVAPRFFDEPGILSPNCTRLIMTDTISQRKTTMEELAEAFIIAPGGIGTFEEFFEVLTLKQLARHSKPMVMLNTLRYFDPLIAAMQRSTEEGFMGKGGLELFSVCATPEEALAQALALPPSPAPAAPLADYNK